MTDRAPGVERPALSGSHRVLVVDDDPDMAAFLCCERVPADDCTALISIVLVTSLQDREGRVHEIRAGGWNRNP